MGCLFPIQQVSPNMWMHRADLQLPNLDLLMMFRDARVGQIGGGSSEIMRNVIAQRMGI